MSGRFVVVALLALLSTGCHRATAPTEARVDPPIGEVWLTDLQVAEAKLKIEPLAEQDVDDVIVTSGKVAFDDAHVAHVFSPVSGRVTRIEAKVGQRVKKGDVLVVLESPDIGIASADLHKAEADRITAEHDLERQKELLAAHATSQRDFEQSEDAFRKSKAEVERAKQKAGLFRTGTGGNVSQTYAVRSEIDGEVVARNVSPGGEVQGLYGGGAAVELFTVGELDRLWVVADVYEMDTPRVKVGSRVNIKLFSMPNKVFPRRSSGCPAPSTPPRAPRRSAAPSTTPIGRSSPRCTRRSSSPSTSARPSRSRAARSSASASRPRCSWRRASRRMVATSSRRRPSWWTRRRAASGYP